MKRLKTGMLLAVAVAIVAPAMLGAQTAADAQAASAAAEVRATIDRLFDGMRAADVAMFRSTLHPSARLMTTSMRDGVPVLAEEAIDAFAEAVSRSQPGTLDERLHDVEIHVDGNLASAWTPYRFYLGERFSHCGVNSFQLFRSGEGWQIIQIVDTRRREGCGV
ncbi:MAG: nuclear transport factor 2 family protein [Gemmatimonadetes bacterium]|nr:nuclear transport factor 2 family protein [Gemmatimonadota bacterium]